MLRILYNVESDWEFDYIQELFSDHKTFFTPLHKKDFSNTSKYKKLTNTIVAYTVNLIDYDVIERFVLEVKPLGVIILSDEWGTHERHQNLAKYTRFVMRNYYHLHYKSFDNIYYLPLGYMFGSINSYSTDLQIISASERRYKWSFIGNIKNQERVEMINQFSKLDNNLVTNGMNSFEMFNVYQNSCFVPSAKGNVHLDCFRLYEATICGAIPVVVCDDAGLITWSKLNNPPWIFAKSWEEAINVCRDLCNNPDQLNQKQAEVVQWWKDIMVNMKAIISQHVQ